jgi:hypothetical protein
MPSTDIDGSPIVILSEEEARRVHARLSEEIRNDIERKIIGKIARDLKLEQSDDL